MNAPRVDEENHSRHRDAFAFRIWSFHTAPIIFLKEKSQLESNWKDTCCCISLVNQHLIFPNFGGHFSADIVCRNFPLGGASFQWWNGSRWPEVKFRSPAFILPLVTWPGLRWLLDWTLFRKINQFTVSRSIFILWLMKHQDCAQCNREKKHDWTGTCRKKQNYW